ncbi:hypothetical protein F751_6030 [Auxenochlorella protothecoides]|uniref:Uncharacterized protein n=1 Tax=Auxenochlorella protothecoides TaxID=3075 RepID=A0A087SCM2_AUXPR|nr:hypothetical protein F751_6030 [Auxenochlorella protothecoides]KFM23476.1 hypothetical protein F751_6030 [Auxenochlorella protothecoides]
MIMLICYEIKVLAPGREGAQVPADAVSHAGAAGKSQGSRAVLHVLFHRRAR